MNLWQLEWLRMLRTKRLLVMVASFVLFGFAGPLTSRYLPDLLARTGGQVTVILPPPTPLDGIDSFLQSATQLGVLVAVVVAAAALSFDATPGLAAFYRTRVVQSWRLVMPRYIVVTMVVIGCLVAGTLAAWYETAIVLGGLPASRMLLGTALECLYFAFVIATVAFAASLVRGTLATVGVSLAILLTLPIAGSIQGLHRWLPSTLASSLSDVLRPSPPPFVAAASAVLCTIGFLTVSAILLSRREV